MAVAAGRERHRIGIIGAGPAGICMAIRLLDAGSHDFVVFDRALGVGGTWFHNRYPGCACDIPSHLYSFSFHLKADWQRPYATQPEILRYLEECVEFYGVEPNLRLGTGIAAARWDEGTATWHLRTDAGHEVVVDVLISALGMFNEPAWLEIGGLENFGGAVFHSARWNCEHDLRDESVAVIGSAASAVQLVPAVATVVRELHVFQRTANWVLPKEDTPYTESELERFRSDPNVSRAERQRVWQSVDLAQTLVNAPMIEMAEAAGRAAIETVRDPDVRSKLTPTHPFGCKRPLVSNDWYSTFNLQNVRLVTDQIVEVTQSGILTADGVERAIDTIVMATGFHTTRFLSAIDVVGRTGRRLQDAWSDGPLAYLGITTAGFPNLFMLYGPNTNNGSIIFQIECQVDYVMRQIQRLDDEGLRWMDVKLRVMDDYNLRLQRDLDAVPAWNAGSCHNYYRVPSGRIVTQWPHGMGAYREWTLLPDADAYEVG